MARALRLGLFLLAAGAHSLAAQFGYFGENKVQYRRFAWRVLAGPHVDVHYYPAEEELARAALAYAEASYDTLARRFAWEVRHRIPLILYASHTDFEQTNILPFVPPEELLGVTDFLKERVTLPFTGSYFDFKHTIRHELVHVFQLALENRASVRYPRLRHVELPLWWTEGLAEHFSIGLDSRGEMILRELTISGDLPSLAQLANAEGGAVYPIGASVHQFLAERYGDWRILELYREIWKYGTFDDLIAAVYGRSLDDLSAEWHQWMRRRYFPAVESGEPLALTARPLVRLAIKPAAWLPPGDTAPRILYFSPENGYTSIYERPWWDGRARRLVEGERTPEFESFHIFDSRMDVGPGDILAFTSKYLDRDALFLYDLRARRLVGRYQFDSLVSILSPSWLPDGRGIVFSGLSASGYSDLYRVRLADGRLERLTADRYQDSDPSVSPDGREVVFSSDRTAYGPHGARNLFVLDLATGAVRYLTYGDWQDVNPRWSPADGRIYFSSDRDGAPQLYAVDSSGAGRRLTEVLGGAFDPELLPAGRGVLFGGFGDLSFNIYTASLAPDTVAPRIALAADTAPAAWRWPELQPGLASREAEVPYRQHFTLDFAAGDAIVAPGLGSAQGVVFGFSDLLGDHQAFAQLSSFQGSGLGGFLDNINGAVFYLNQAHRINWGVGAFRLRGRFFEGDLTTLYDETSLGVFGQLRYPFDRFRRLELEYRLEHSNRFDFADAEILNGGDPTALHRVAWLASNYLSFVKDNTLWLDTGPIDGERYDFSGGVVNDVSHGRFDSWVFYGDYRRYLRTTQRSAVAFRGIVYYGGGERPERVNIGGPWGLRGYPFFGYVAGSRAWMLNLEWRFPITDYLTIGFPFAPLQFPGIQGAFFADWGRAWTPLTAGRGPLGAAGFGFRMPLAPPVVLRLDVGWRFHAGDPTLYSLSEAATSGHFVSFFFGYNY